MNDSDIEKTANLLKQFKPGFLPYPVFEQIARLVALPIVEFVPLRRKDGKTEVLLIAREDDDPIFPGLLHTPGTVIRATDLHDGRETNWPAFSRVLEDELAGTKVSAPHYVGSIFHASKRGAEQAQLYWVEILEEPRVGRFYDVQSLPEGLMDSQVAFIRQAVRSFESEKPQN